MKIIEVTNENVHVLQNLAQAYEAEFSAMTRKTPDQDGIFRLDTPPDALHTGYLLFDNDLPVGFGIIGLVEGRNDVAEFYVIPSVRGQGLGESFAHRLFSMHEGEWQVRQIEGAQKATDFWRKTISTYTNGQFTESIVDDADWGKVTRQLFSSKQ